MSKDCQRESLGDVQCLKLQIVDAWLFVWPLLALMQVGMQAAVSQSDDALQLNPALCLAACSPSHAGRQVRERYSQNG